MVEPTFTRVRFPDVIEGLSGVHGVVVLNVVVV